MDLFFETRSRRDETSAGHAKLKAAFSRSGARRLVRLRSSPDVGGASISGLLASDGDTDANVSIQIHASSIDGGYNESCIGRLVRGQVIQ